LLAEAALVARSLEVLLKRAQYDTTAAAELINSVKRQESIELQKAFGRVESRNRMRRPHFAQPLLVQRPRNILFVDESGKSNRETLPTPTFFALGAISMDEVNVASYCSAADRIKLEFFGTSDVTFHEPEMRHHDGRYNFNGDANRQRQFDLGIEELLVNVDFVVFGVGVRKAAFERDFVDAGVDPYLPTDAYALAITMLLERYVDYLANGTVDRLGHLTFESQGPKEDVYHQLEYARVLLEGSQWVSESSFRNWLETGLDFAPKQGSSPLELADMFARDFYEWIRGDCTTVPARWELFSPKMYCRDDGLRGKFGVKVFPDSDIRDVIEEHRKSVGATL